MWKNPHSLHAKEREERCDGVKGLDTSKTGRSMEVLDVSMVMICAKRISLHEVYKPVCSLEETNFIYIHLSI